MCNCVLTHCLSHLRSPLFRTSHERSSNTRFSFPCPPARSVLYSCSVIPATAAASSSGMDDRRCHLLHHRLFGRNDSVLQVGFAGIESTGSVARLHHSFLVNAGTDTVWARPFLTFDSDLVLLTSRQSAFPTASRLNSTSAAGLSCELDMLESSRERPFPFNSLLLISLSLSTAIPSRATHRCKPRPTSCCPGRVCSSITGTGSCRWRWMQPSSTSAPSRDPSPGHAAPRSSRAGPGRTCSSPAAVEVEVEAAAVVGRVLLISWRARARGV